MAQIKVNGRTITQNGVKVGEIKGRTKGEYTVKAINGNQTSRLSYFADAISYAKNNPNFFTA